LSRWETISALEANVSPTAVWERAYANAEAWPKWNAEIKRVRFDGPLALGAEAKIVFGTGLRLRFRVVEFEAGRLFTDEARMPGGRMGHRHLIEPTESGGCRLSTRSTSKAPWLHCGGGSWGQRRHGPCPMRSGRSSRSSRMARDARASGNADKTIRDGL
jgi:Polyketide cyclase / dehydrase and lipid transport